MAGRIQVSRSPWAASIILVPKKDETLWLCIDYRKLNAVTRPDSFPMPQVEDLIDGLAGATYITTLDQHRDSTGRCPSPDYARRQPSPHRLENATSPYALRPGGGTRDIPAYDEYNIWRRHQLHIWMTTSFLVPVGQTTSPT